MEDVEESAPTVPVVATVENAVMSTPHSNNASHPPESIRQDTKLLPRHYTECEFTDLVDLIIMLPILKVFVYSHVDANR